MAQAG